MDRGAWWVTVHGVTESDATEQVSTAQALSVNNSLRAERKLFSLGIKY